MKYAINERIYFEMDIIRARCLCREYKRQRLKAFNREMRKVRRRIEQEMFRDIERKFKKCGRGRP